MGSSSGKKHKKDKKHSHRSRSQERQQRGVDEDVTLDLTDDSSSTRHRHHKHKKHKEHRHKHHKQKERERPSEVISLEESDSDSSDCVEVPVEQAPKAKPREREAPTREREPLIRERGREREQLVREREPAIREREPAIREREPAIREREPPAREREHEISAPPPPQISKHADYERERRREREIERERDARKRAVRERERGRGRSGSHSPTAQAQQQRPHSPSRKRGIRDRERERDQGRERERERVRSRSHSPIPENGAGDVLSIAETNKLRAKLGLKPLEVDSGPTRAPPASSTSSGHQDSKRSGAEKDLSSYKDEWGEFLHKPADNIKDIKEAKKLREKLTQRKEKRFLEERLARIRTLGESDEETDNVSKWVDRNKRVVNEREEALRKAKELEELDEAFGVTEIVEQEKQKARQTAYGDRHLKGLRVEHDMDDFGEGRTVILTLKDQDVLNEEEGDALVNVNMIDDERYKKNIANKKLNPLSYGYNVYEEQYDELGNPIERSILEKYDEDVEGKPQKRKNFVIGENVDEEREHRRKLLEIKTKLSGKRLETLQDTNIQLASDTFSVEELASFKKPKKKIKKLRQKLKAEDLEPIAETSSSSHLGTRNGRYREADDEDFNMKEESKSQIKLENDQPDDVDDDLERVLSKARKLKQKENIIKMPIDMASMQPSIKSEPVDEPNSAGGVEISSADSNIVLNATAEFCRTLGDIPTYGMAGNRNEDSNDMMDFDKNETLDEHMDTTQEEPTLSHGTWNSVNPDEVMQPADLDNLGDDIEERAILDEEPDVGAGVANALRLALSKGYLEKEEKNRPSNTKMAHLQAKNYSIEDKAAGEDDKIGRRDRFHAGPIMDFKDKETFKPNVKLDYIDDNGRILNLKEAFRYLSHKFHGKGPGKNKIEKRLKKMEQDGLMKTMSSTDTPLCTLTMLQQKQKETKTPYVVLSGSNKTTAGVSGASISKFK